jgi:hypothetical protein
VQHEISYSANPGYLWYYRQQLALALHPNPVSNLLCKVETDCLFPGRVVLPGPTDHSISLGDFVCKDWVWGRGGKRRGEVLQFARVPMFYTYLTLEVHSSQLVQLLIQRCSQVWSFHSVRIVLWCILELMCIVYPSPNQHILPFFLLNFHHLVTPKNPVPIIHRDFVKKNAPKSADMEGKIPMTSP